MRPERCAVTSAGAELACCTVITLEPPFATPIADDGVTDENLHEAFIHSSGGWPPVNCRVAMGARTRTVGWGQTRRLTRRPHLKIEIYEAYVFFKVALLRCETRKKLLGE